MKLLEQLAAPRALAGLLLLGHLLGQEEVTGQLLRDRAGPDQVRALPGHVGDDRSDDADRIDAGVVVEAPVLDGDHGLADALGDGLERDAPPAFPWPRDQAAQRRRIEGDPRARPAVHLDAGDPRRRRGPGCRRPRRRRREGHRHEGGGRAAGPRSERHRGAVDGEHPGPVGPPALGVADVVQAGDELGGADRLAGIEGQRPRVDSRDDAVALAGEAGIDEPGERDVVVAGDGRTGDADDGERDGERPEQSASLQRPPGLPGATGPSAASRA